jgi:hypothetical protein
MDVVGDDDKSIKGYAIKLHREAQRAKDDFLVLILSEQGLPFQNGDGEKLRVVAVLLYCCLQLERK